MKRKNSLTQMLTDTTILDKEIAAVIRHVNTLGYLTCGSCSGHGNMAHVNIVFPIIRKAFTFIEKNLDILITYDILGNISNKHIEYNEIKEYMVSGANNIEYINVQLNQKFTMCFFVQLAHHNVVEFETALGKLL